MMRRPIGNMPVRHLIPCQSSMTVNYFVQGESSPFYSYAINVNAGILFNEGFARVIDATAPGGAKLVNNTVVNSLNVTQTVQSDLSLMTQIGAQYRYSDFAFVEANRSEDGKTVNLYYTFNSTKTFVVDFGLPLVINPTDMSVGLTSDKLTGIEINQTTTYANITTNNNYEITYTLNKTIDGQDNFGVKYTGEIATAEGTQSDSVEYSITIIPASTVYYEDSFVTFSEPNEANNILGWTRVTDVTETEENATQALEELGGNATGKNVYGYDPAYANCTMFSMGSAMKATVSGQNYATATFTFKGTGFDIISLTSNTTGTIVVTVTGENNYKKNYIVDTYYGYRYDEATKTWVVDENRTDTLYQIPVMKVTDLPYGTYTAKVTAAYNEVFAHNGTDRYDFYLDAVRVYDPMGEDYSRYTEDDEGYPQYIKLRNALVSGDATIAGNNGVVFIDGGDTAEIATYANYGPNNEVYLTNGQAISFTVPENTNIATVQIGAKAPSGTAQMVVNNGEATEISTATEMYYKLNVSSGGSVTITNTGDGILSLTNLKITFTGTQEDAVALATLSDEAQTAAVMTVRALFAAAPVEPEPDPTFAPERFEAAWNRSTVRAGQKVTLTVKTSEDVEAVMVDGVTIDTYRTRTQRTGWGQNATKVTYREFTYTITAAETADYAITAVNAEGIASEPITVTLTVQAASQRPSFGGWLDKIFGRWF